jgi:predicted enzyme related to lactoylglutathione lyase
MFRKLRTVIYHVDDIKKAKQWYKHIIGIQPYFDQPFYVGFDIDGYELGLDPDMTNADPGNQSVAYWLVDNIEVAFKKLIENNASVISAIAEVGDGIKVAVLKDPFGNAVGLIEETS